jgi:hypothetical protein
LSLTIGRRVAPDGAIFQPIVDAWIRSKDFSQAIQYLTGLIIQYGVFRDVSAPLNTVLTALAQENFVDEMKKLYEATAAKSGIFLDGDTVAAVFGASVCLSLRRHCAHKT